MGQKIEDIRIYRYKEKIKHLKEFCRLTEWFSFTARPTRTSGDMTSSFSEIWFRSVSIISAFFDKSLTRVLTIWEPRELFVTQISEDMWFLK